MDFIYLFFFFSFWSALLFNRVKRELTLGWIFYAQIEFMTRNKNGIKRHKTFREQIDENHLALCVYQIGRVRIWLNGKITKNHTISFCIVCSQW